MTNKQIPLNRTTRYDIMKPTYVERPKYLNRIKPFVGNPNAKILMGIRRCGKSTILTMLADEIKRNDPKANIIRINFELMMFQDLKNYEKLYSYIKEHCKNDVNNYLFVDEIHEADGWEMAIRSLLAEQTCEIFITGSNSKLLSSEYTTYLGGRYNSVKAQPLSLNECVSFSNKKSAGLDTNDVFERYLRQGGFPIIWVSDYSDVDAYSMLRDIYSVIISKDLIDRYRIRNKELLDRIVAFICDNVGSVTSLNNIYIELSKEYKDIARTTVYEYVEYLENAHFLIRTNSYDIKGKKILSPSYKFYLADIGMKHALMGYKKEDISKHLENIVFLELLNRGYDVFVGTVQGKEIDFVAKRSGEILYVQVTYLLSSEETIEREFGNLKKINDNHPKYVVGMDPTWKGGGNIEGIRYRDISEFLLSDDW